MSFRYLLLFAGFFYVTKVEALGVQVFDHPLKLTLSPLIGGPSWMLVHCKVVLDDSYIFDFVPLKATSTETIQKMIQLQAVPAKVQIIRRSKRQKNDDNDINYKHEKNDNNNVNDENIKVFVERAEQFCQEYDQDLHLLQNNCWSFAYELILYILYPKKGVSFKIDK